MGGPYQGDGERLIRWGIGGLLSGGDEGTLSWGDEGTLSGEIYGVFLSERDESVPSPFIGEINRYCLDKGSKKVSLSSIGMRGTLTLSKNWNEDIS